MIKKSQSPSLEEILTRGIEEIVVKPHLLARLKKGDKLRIKHGVDPTGPKIHLGRASQLWKLKEFQDLGHKIIFIIGDYTAQIGDPSDKLSKRPFLTESQIKENLKNYKKQIGLILDLSKIDFQYNSHWLSKLSPRQLDELADLFSVQQMIARRNFRERWKKKEEISIRELHYPLYQGYDSVVVKSDLEIGGSDQLFNILAGRKIQEHFGQFPQDIITTKMLLGLDGRKMSTSWGNIVTIVDEPSEMYGKIMSMNDDLILDYFELCTRLSLKDIKEIKNALKTGANPRNIKAKLAFEIVSLYHGKTKAIKAEKEFNQIFKEKELPTEIPEIKVASGSVKVANLLVTTKLVSSKSEARRLIDQGGVRVDQNAIRDREANIIPKSGMIIQVGKRRFIKLKAK